MHVILYPLFVNGIMIFYASVTTILIFYFLKLQKRLVCSVQNTFSNTAKLESSNKSFCFSLCASIGNLSSYHAYKFDNRYIEL